MKNLHQTILIATLLISAQPTLGKDQSTIVLDQSLSAEKSDGESSSDRTTAWVLYGITRMTAMQERARSHRRYVPPNDYPAELSARSILAKFWREQREKGSEETDTYLDTLVAIADAGFLDEYVISTFVSPGWTIKANDIAAFDFAGFTTWWGEQHLKDFETVTLAGFETKGSKIKHEPPGSTLPEPYDFLPGQVSCTKVTPILNKAAKRWEKEAKSLPGTPIAADSRQDVLALINWIRNQPVDEKASYTFVPSRVGSLIFIAGYCGVDIHDHKSAERWLKMAVKLLPLQMMPRLELAQTYIVGKRFEEADALVDEILNATEDRCSLGSAWRKRGFIRFEQGRLEDSRSAYKRSLEYDPYSRIALSELALLETEITRHGGTSDTYKPPPTNPQTTTECKPMSVMTLPGAA